MADPVTKRRPLTGLKFTMAAWRWDAVSRVAWLRGGYPPLRCARSGLDEGHEVWGDDVGLSGAHAVQIARVLHLKGAVLELLDRQLGRVRDCDDLVIVSVHDQCRDLDWRTSSLQARSGGMRLSGLGG